MPQVLQNDPGWVRGLPYGVSTQQVLGPGGVMGTAQANNPSILSDADLNTRISQLEQKNKTVGLQSADAEILANHRAELANRQNAAQMASEKKLSDLFGGGTGTPTSTVDPALIESANNQRSALNDIFGSQQKAGLQNLNDIFNKQRGDVIDEQAALGRLGSPVSSVNLTANDAQRNKAISDFISSIAGAKGTAQAGLEGDLAGRLQSGSQFGQTLGFNKANALAGFGEKASEFGQTFGLDMEKFNEEKRKTNLEELFNRDALTQAGELGRASAEANKPTALGQIGEIATGLGGLTGGVGGLLTGLGTSGLLSKKKK